MQDRTHMLQRTRQFAKRILGPQAVARIRRWRHGPDFDANVQERACHFDFPFITHNGDVYPCCRRWGRDEYHIGNIADADLTDRLRRFSKPCACHSYRLRQALPGERPRGANLELSLACHAKCSVCCVEAPSWNQDWDRFEDLSRFINEIEPQVLIVQGGEILVQKESMNWLREVKRRRPEIQLNLVTNGSVPVARVADVESLFERVVVSFVGFQPETYENNMGLHVDRAKAFTQELLARGSVLVAPKFLITPTAIHEINPFLEWTLPLGPHQVLIFDAQTLHRISGNASDPFWKQTFERTSRKLKATLVRHREELQRHGTVICFEPPADELLGIDEEFLEAQRLRPFFRRFLELGWHMPQWQSVAGNQPPSGARVVKMAARTPGTVPPRDGAPTADLPLGKRPLERR